VDTAPRKSRKATPLWHAIAFGRNLPLAKFLLSRGSDPHHCLFAAAYNGDIRDNGGRTVADIMRRKKDPEFHRFAERLKG
jgi:hypothetical protein